MIPIGETAHVRRGAGATFHEDEEFPRAEQDLWFVNTCQAWRADGPLHARVPAGAAAGLREFPARRDDSRGGLGGHFEARPIQ